MDIEHDETNLSSEASEPISGSGNEPVATAGSIVVVQQDQTATRGVGSSKPDLLQWSRFYRDQHGAVPIALNPGQKHTTRKAWQRSSGYDAELDGTLVDGGNLGLLLGAPSDGLVDVDLDVSIARDLAPYFLPATSWISGHAGNPRSHWWYRVAGSGTGADFPKTQKLTRPADSHEVWIEIRSTGAQTVVPPSIHPDSGAAYQWEGGHPSSGPAAISEVELLGAVKQLYAATILAPYWVDGARHDLSLPLVGALLRGGIPEEQVAEFLGRLCSAMGDKEDRRSAVRTTAERIQNGDQVQGGKTLSSLLGEAEAREFLAAFGIGGGPETSSASGVPCTPVRLDPTKIGITGAEAFRKLRDAESAEPLFGHLLPGKLHLLSGPSNAGKSSLLLWYACHWAAGDTPDLSLPRRKPIDPWVLFISADATTSEISEKVERFDRSGEGWFGFYNPRVFERFMLICLDTARFETLGHLRANKEGAITLRHLINDTSTRFGGGQGLVVLDALSDFLPPGANENDNAEMAEVMGRLAEVASDTGTVLMVLHHWPKGAHGKGTDGDYSALTVARGATAISTKPRVVMTLERYGSKGVYRRMRIVANSLPDMDPIYWQTCDPEGEGRGIYYWKVDPKAEEETDQPDPSEVDRFVGSFQGGRDYNQTEAVRLMKGLKIDDPHRPTPAEREHLKLLLEAAKGRLEETPPSKPGAPTRIRRCPTTRGTDQ